MIPNISIVGLFCEDIRQEKAGTETIVGVFPSNIAFPGLPMIFPRFGLYARINIDPMSADIPIEIRIEGPGMEGAVTNTIDPKLIAKAKADARDQNAPLACIISRMLVASFPVTEAGRICAIAKVDSDEFVCASLNVKVETEQMAATETAAS